VRRLSCETLFGLDVTSFRWLEFLEFAECLWKGNLSKGEALGRSVISRAYYAAYHAALTHLGERGAQGRGSSHDRTWTALASSNDPRETLIGQDGDNLKRLRVHADYESRAVSEQHVLQALSLARKVRRQLDALHAPVAD
jgi:hypothetical protein